jgi:uncharacterized membrane protein (DUF2068 family)
MDWSLLSCGRGGHVTYAPDEPDLRGRLSTVTPAGTAWRCLRCGTFVPGEPDGSGPVAAAPAVRRGREVRSALILRLFAIERYLRAVVFGGAAFGVWRLKYSRTSLQQAFNHDLPAVRALYKDLGFNFQNSKLIGLIQHALTLNSRTLGYLAIGLAAYAVIEFIEATGLWLVKRWGEYFALVATAVFLPYEIYELVDKVTVLRAGAFAVNLALVVYLVLTKRMLGVRGGKAAYEERLREASIIDAELEALAAAAPGSPAPQPPGAEPGEPAQAAEPAEAGAAQPGAASR